MIDRIVSRRDLLRRTGHGLGMAALTSIMGADGLLATDNSIDLRPKPTHFPAQAKAVIQLFQAGGPSQMDLFDPKPELQKRDATHYICPARRTPIVEHAAWAARTSSASTASAAWISPNCCRTPPPSPTTCAWCAPCSASTRRIPKE